MRPLILLLSILLSGCGVLTTTVMVTGAAVVTAADLAVDGASSSARGSKTGEMVVDVVKGTLRSNRKARKLIPDS